MSYGDFLFSYYIFSVFPSKKALFFFFLVKEYSLSERHIEQKRIFALFDQRNGRTKHRKRFLLYLAIEIAKIQSRRIKNNMTLIFCLYMFLVQTILYQLT